MGTVTAVDATDEKAPYLVAFSDGLQFRYKAKEIEHFRRDFGEIRSILNP